MLKALFMLLRVLTGLGAVGALAGTLLVMLVYSAQTALKSGFHIGLTLARFFASGLRDTGSSGSTGPGEHLVPRHLVALAVLFLAMLVSVFTPGVRLFLHIVAAGALVAAAWRAWTMGAAHDAQLQYIPLIAIWFVYYAICLRRE